MRPTHGGQHWIEAPASGIAAAAASARVVGVPRTFLYEYTAGDSLAGALVSCPGARYYMDASGVLRLAAAGVVRDAHYINGVRHTLTEQGRTNLALWCRDLTNAVWVKSNATVTLDQTGADGVASSASRITATANNATVIQSITAASALRAASAFVRRKTGTGTIWMTLDGGATWTIITPGASYAQLSVPRQTLANPAIGFKLATSGDEIVVDFSQVEQSIPSSPILTTNATATRVGESIGLPVGALPSEFTIYADATDQGVAVMLVNVRLVQLSASANTVPRVLIFAGNAGHFNAQLVNEAATVTTANQPGGLPAKGDRFESVAQIAAGGTIASLQSINGGPSTSGVSPAITPAAAWAGQYLWLGTDGTSVGLAGVTAICKVRVAADLRSVEYMRDSTDWDVQTSASQDAFALDIGNGEYRIIDSDATPCVITDNGTEYTLATTGTPGAYVAEGDTEFSITTDPASEAASLVLDADADEVILLPDSADELRFTQLGTSSILAFE